MSTLVTALVVALAIPPGPVAYTAFGPAETDETAKQLYEDGRRAYRKGDMALAVEKFEGAYDLTENPIILYNIGLAYRRLYDESKDITHLRRAKVVLENFRLELARDSGLGSPDEVATVLEEVATTLSTEEKVNSGGGEEPDENETGTEAGPEAEPERPEPEPEPEGPVGADSAPRDPGKGLKLGGYVALGVGGALAIGAGVVAGVFLGKRNTDLAALDQSVADAQAANCGDSETSGVCADYLDQREALTLRANLNQDRGVIGGIGLGAGAAVAIGTGVALVVLGTKKSKAVAVANRLQVAPWGRGASLSLRF
jgi:hypothetical protein